MVWEFVLDDLEEILRRVGAGAAELDDDSLWQG